MASVKPTVVFVDEAGHWPGECACSHDFMEHIGKACKGCLLGCTEYTEDNLEWLLKHETKKPAPSCL